MEALVELHDQAIRFLRDPGQRLLHVVSPAGRRTAVLEVLRGLEHGPWAPGPVVVLEPAHGAADPGWGARAELLRRQHEARRVAGEAAGERWPGLARPPAEKGLAGFAEQLGQVVAATPGERGWVVVLAPAHVKAAPQWSRAIAMLLRGSALGRVRWVVVDGLEPSLVDHVAAEHELRRVRCDADHDAAGGLAQRLASMGAGAGAPGARPAGVTAPPRPGKPPAPAEDREAPQRRELAQLLLAAAAAQRDGQGASAVELQRRARDLCAAAGWRDLAVQMELVLAGYLLGAGAGPEALDSTRRAVQAATTQPRPELVPIAELALGSMLVVRGDRPAAMLAYADAVTSAERAGSTALMLEACRLTGDAAALLGMEAQALAFWSRAVRLAEAEPLYGALGSAGHCARAMALLCSKRGLHDPAKRHFDAARRLEGIDVAALRAASAVEQVPPSEPPALVPFAPSTPTAPLTGVTAEPPLAAIAEGTADLSLEELAALHWQGMLPGRDDSATPPTILHHWTTAEQDAIRRATEAVMTDDTTAMLTREEIFALHGEAELPPAREASPAATAILERATTLAMLRLTDPEAEGTAWLPEAELSEIRTRLGHLPPAEPPPPLTPPEPAQPVPEPRVLPELPDGPGDTTSMLTRERLAELARQHAARSHKPDGR